MNAYLQAILMALATGASATLATVSTQQPPRDWESAAISGAAAAVGALLSALRSLQTPPPGKAIVNQGECDDGK